MRHTHLATWLGGPWDGATVRLDSRARAVPASDPRRSHGILGMPLDDLLGPLGGPRLCPVVERADGRFLIDWHAGHR